MCIRDSPIIDFMPEQKNIDKMGGTMRLGQYACALTPGTKVYAAYGEDLVHERHRHRYEFNNEYLSLIHISPGHLQGRARSSQVCGFFLPFAPALRQPPLASPEGTGHALSLIHI